MKQSKLPLVSLLLCLLSLLLASLADYGSWPTAVTPSPTAAVPKPTAPIPKPAPATPQFTKVKIKMWYNGAGWIGVGVSAAGRMIGSVAAIGVPDQVPSTVQKYDLSGKFVGSGGVAPSSNQNLQNYSVSQVQNQTISQTVMEFITFLDWNNGSLPFESSGSTHMVYAYGSDNTLGYHKNRANFTVNLAFCLDEANKGDSKCQSDDGNYDQVQVFSDGVKVYSKLIW